MADISLEIRKVIFEKYNNPDIRFTNDEIFEILKQNNAIDKSLLIDDMEKYFTDLCDAGLMRNIAQNFTTQYFKLFDDVEKVKCNSCNAESPIGKSESRICPSCKASI
ncbi:MAG: hypothetical protein EPO62_08105 [Candidatus Nitrosotenuis sp.]|nr:MAG: hypothetical protein EPO62_08105 [Candidatus Nitrosotenuis sp.]